MSRIFFHILLTVMLGVFLISTSVQATEVKLVVTGVKGALRKNVEAALSLPTGLVRDGQVNRRWLQRLVEKAPRDGSRALEPFGYYQAQVHVTLEEGKDKSLLQVRVDPGKPVRLGKVQVEVQGAGSGESLLRRMVEDFPIKPGDQLNHEDYDEAKLALRVAAVDLGYLKSDFRRSEVRVDSEAYRADVNLQLETGPLFYFGPIRIEGAESFPRDFLWRYLEFSPGEIFSYDQLNRTRINYLKANRFSEIQLVPEIDRADHQLVPIRISLKAGAKRRLRSGVGYGTNTGARLTINYQDLNLWQKAHRFETDLSLAQKSRALTSRYTIPLPGHKENAWALGAGLAKEDIDIYETEVAHLEGERVFGLGRDAVGSLFLREQREDYTISRRSDISTLLLTGLRYHRRHYDDPVNPKQGFQYRFELAGSYDDAFSDTSLLQLKGGAALMQPLSQNWTLLLRSHFGLLAHDDPFDEVPASLRFFVGGDNSVRGYAYKSRGPVDGFGQVTGGDGLFSGSMEAEYAFSKRYGGALFYDTGSAFKAFHEVRFIHGIGAGFRVYTPVGPIKVDLARQLHQNDGRWRIHLSVGFDL